MSTPVKNQYAGPNGQITQWVADVNARRVPLFVIGLTKLRTKTEIQEEYGYGAVFRLGKDGKGTLVRKGKVEKKAK